MPTYEYECGKCGHRFEKFQGINDPPVKTCPECRGRVRRLPGTGAGLIFKGQGFYITDYRSKDYHAKAKAESGTASGGSSESPAPAKPAPKKGSAGKGDGAGGKGGKKST